MKVLAYNPSDDLFFIGASFDELLKLEAEYRINSDEFSVENAKQFIDEENRFASDGAFSYFDMIKNMYKIDTVPDICFFVPRNLSVLTLMSYDFPFHHMWNAYSPWIRVYVTEISNLAELLTLNCQERIENV